MGFISDAIGGIFGGSQQGNPTQTVTNVNEMPAWLQYYYTGNPGEGTVGTLKEANRLYKEEVPEYFPGSTVTPYGEESLDALQMQEDLARGGSPLLGTAYDQVSNMAAGGMLGGNPYIDQVISDLTEDVTEGVNTNAFFSGRESSPHHAGAVAREVGRMAAPIRMQDYQAERGYMQDALRMAPAVEEFRYDPSRRLAGVGAAREAKSAEELADQIARHDFEQMMPHEQLSRYASIVGGAPVVSSGTTTTYQPQPGFSASGFLGGGIGGASLGSMLGASTMWPYALGGALLGGF